MQGILVMSASKTFFTVLVSIICRVCIPDLELSQPPCSMAMQVFSKLETSQMPNLPAIIQSIQALRQ